MLLALILHLSFFKRFVFFKFNMPSPKSDINNSIRIIFIKLSRLMLLRSILTIPISIQENTILPQSSNSINPLQKHHTPLVKAPPQKKKNLQTVQGSLFMQFPLYIYIYIFLWTPLKLGFFCEPPKYSSFSPFSPSYLLKVTKFLVKISQFIVYKVFVIKSSKF